jgi:hypothetical protein
MVTHQRWMESILTQAGSSTREFEQTPSSGYFNNCVDNKMHFGPRSPLGLSALVPTVGTFFILLPVLNLSRALRSLLFVGQKVTKSLGLCR